MWLAGAAQGQGGGGQGQDGRVLIAAGLGDKAVVLVHGGSDHHCPGGCGTSRGGGQAQGQQRAVAGFAGAGEGRVEPAGGEADRVEEPAGAGQAAAAAAAPAEQLLCAVGHQGAADPDPQGQQAKVTVRLSSWISPQK